MADWGTLAGLQGLYAYPSKREAAREELANLQLLSQEMQADKEREELNQLKVQEYQNQVKTFADSLLGPDRDKINEKARILGKHVQDLLKASGGDYTKFLENGGHSIMADYQSNLINSPEASTYLTNRKNSELITNIVMSGKGHLVPLRDMESFRNYQSNGGGKITYSGMLSEVEMPEYTLGEFIPAEMILAHNNNYIAIYGNYKLEFPDAPEPTKKDLIDYVNSRYREQGKSTAQADQAYKNEQLQMAREKHELDKAHKIAQIQNERAKANPNYNNPNSESDGTRTEFEYNTALQLRNSLSGVSASEVSTALNSNPFWSQRIGSGATKYVDMAPNTNPNEKNSTILGEAIEESAHAYLKDADRLVARRLSPHESYEIFQNYNPVNFFSHLVGATDEQVNKQERTISNVAPKNNWFWADGVTFGSRNIDLDKYNGDWTAKTVISGWTVDTEDGPRMMMDARDGSFDKKLKKSYAESDATLGMFVVVENADGNRAYVPLPLEGSQAMQYSQSLMSDPDLASMNIASTMIDYDVKNQRNKYATELANRTVQNTNNVLNMVSMNPEFNRSIDSESRMYSPVSNSGLRRNLIKSFYTGFTAMQGLQEQPLIDFYSDISSSGEFGVFVSEMKGMGYKDIDSDLKSGYTDMQIMQKALSIAENIQDNSNSGSGPQETINFIRSWMAAYSSVVNFNN